MSLKELTQDNRSYRQYSIAHCLLSCGQIIKYKNTSYIMRLRLRHQHWDYLMTYQELNGLNYCTTMRKQLELKI